MTLALWALGAFGTLRIATYLVLAVRVLLMRGPKATVVEVVSPPAGEAPLEVRKAWVGLRIPLAKGETGVRVAAARRMLADQQSLQRMIRRFLLGPYGIYYSVETQTAFALLRNWSPASYAWWCENTPALFEPGRKFGFHSESCRIVRDETDLDG